MKVVWCKPQKHLTWHSHLWFLWICVSQMKLLKQHTWLVTQSRGVCSVWRTAYTPSGRWVSLERLYRSYAQRRKYNSCQSSFCGCSLDCIITVTLFSPRFFFSFFQGSNPNNSESHVVFYVLPSLSCVHMSLCENLLTPILMISRNYENFGDYKPVFIALIPVCAKLLL